MAELLIILCPPRSFSSVVSTMIGQHPQLYGFPELHLFGSETVGQIVHGRTRKDKAAPAGLVRTIAQEVYGVQTTETVLKAIDWLREHQSWTTKQLFDHLVELVHPKIGVEKSPQTAKKLRYLERSYDYFPDSYYLHLTRHPVSSRASIEEFFLAKARKAPEEVDRSDTKAAVDALLVWYLMHRNILNFTNGLPAGQTMMVKGEEVLSDPDLYLPQLARWMGIRADTEAIECMKHPEDSPYAYTGPPPVFGGNDGKFMRSPKLRFGRLREPSLVRFLKENRWQFATDEFKQSLYELAEEEGRFEVPDEDDFLDGIIEMTHMMGYA